MRLLPIIITLQLLISASGLAWAEEEKVIIMPPASLEQWYKPANKRQVWLHTMFRLRREMQAVEEYIALENHAGTKKWGQRLVNSYRKISEMVPEWQDEINMEWADRLEKAVIEGNFKLAARARKKLENTCNSCHREFRSLAAALYRVPDYSKLQVTFADKEYGYPEFMDQLTRSVNRIKIATEDQHPKVAAQSLAKLNQQLLALEVGCAQCHSDKIPLERILGAATRTLLKDLEKSIKDNQPKQTGKLLGKAAVAICARCHGVHRIIGDLKQFLAPGF
ncbi:hypothetical protein MNBD_GAMMA26-929 [hydrothermal vent metagenome]|uniref:Cytochrome c-552/4 domain-containing protein n=1 Tax=hydrothermal vent metagenome TaxID=652676 RepID=A0A3B1AWK1_9ZZZZ